VDAVCYCYRVQVPCKHLRILPVHTAYLAWCPEDPQLAAGRVWHVQAYAFNKTEEYSGHDITYLTASSNSMLHPEAKVVVGPLLCKMANFLLFDPGHRLAISGCHLSDHFINYLMADSSRC
jgi:hypothetical protein